MKIFFIPFWLVFIPFWFLTAFTKSHNCLGLSCPSRCGLQEQGSQASLWVLLAGYRLGGGTWPFASLFHGKGLGGQIQWFPRKTHEFRGNSWRWPALYRVASSESTPFSSPLVHSTTVKHDYQGPATAVAFTWSITVASWGSAEWKSPVSSGCCTCGIHKRQEIKALHCLWEPCLHLNLNLQRQAALALASRPLLPVGTALLCESGLPMPGGLPQGPLTSPSPHAALHGQSWAIIGGACAAGSPGYSRDSHLHPGQGAVHHAVEQEAVQPGISISTVNR